MKTLEVSLFTSMNTLTNCVQRSMRKPFVNEVLVEDEFSLISEKGTI